MNDPHVMTEHRLTRQVGDRTDTALFIRFVDGSGYIEVNGEESACSGDGEPDDWRVGWDWLVMAGFIVLPSPEAEQDVTGHQGT